MNQPSTEEVPFGPPPVCPPSLERKARVIADLSMRNYHGFTEADYELELNIAYRMLESLGVKH